MIRLVKQGDGAGSWDAGRLQQVVSNLVGNALQYGPRDAVVRVMSSGAGREWVTSNPREGTRFVVRLARDATAPA